MGAITSLLSVRFSLRTFLYRVLVLSLLLWGVTIGPVFAQIYVDTDASGANNGTSWADAYTNLQTAIDNAAAGDEIWVADGAYYPDEGGGIPDGKTDTSFVIPGTKDGVGLYGGFAGTESSRGDRDPEANVTVLSGDVDQDDVTNSLNVTETVGDTTGTNSNNVLYLDGREQDVTGSTVIDGFTITAGQATSGGSERGGGLYCDAFEGGECSPRLRNLAFRGNSAAGSGGAIHLEATGTSLGGTTRPNIERVIFAHNQAFASGSNAGGGAVSSVTYAGTASPVIVNTVFRENMTLGTETGNGGGAFFTAVGGSSTAGSGTARPYFANVTFSENSVPNGDARGGAVYGAVGDPTYGTVELGMTNSILWGNSAAGSGDQLYNDGGTSTFAHSIVEGSGGSANWDTSLGTDDGGNLDADPLFVDAASGDVHVNWASPTIDAGDSTALDTSGNGTRDLTEDLDGNDRVRGADADIGAYEGGTVPDVGTVTALRVDATDGTDGGTSGGTWSTPYRTLQAALAASRNAAQAEGGLPFSDVWVVEGAYYPDEGPGIPDGKTDTSFVVTGVQDGLGLFGGFDGTESDRSGRDPEANVTVLSGDVDQDDTRNNGITEDPGSIGGENANHVLWLEGTSNPITSATVMDGMTVTAGQANGSGSGEDGGGLYCNAGRGNVCNPTIRTVVFVGNEANYGGALFNRGADFSEIGEASPTIVDAEFRNNAATSGGAIYNYGNPAGATASPVVKNTVFLDNEASGGGGGIYNSTLNGGTTNPTLVNVTFDGNSSRGSQGGGALLNSGDGVAQPVAANTTFLNNTAIRGGAIANRKSGAVLTLINATFADNSASSFSFEAEGGALFNEGSATIENTILWGNSASNGGGGIHNDGGTATVGNSIVEGGANGDKIENVNGGAVTENGENFNANPLFTRAPEAPVTLNWASPAIDAGDPTVLDTTNNGTADITVDLDGEPREQGATVDIGAYEGGTAPAAGPIRVDAAAASDGDSSGVSWAAPYRTLQAGLAAARNAHAAGVDLRDIRVAEGVYYPDDGPGREAGARTEAFVIDVPELRVRGGFANGDGLGERDPRAKPTVLSGDIDGDDATTPDGIVETAGDISGSNSYTVVEVAHQSGLVELDGLVITGGSADGGSFSTANGAGVFVQANGDTRTVGTTFSGNAAAQGGGGLLVDDASMTVINSVFAGNEAATGGAVHDRGTSDRSTTVVNTVFSGNEATGDGGGVYVDGVSPTLTNVTFSNNNADRGGALAHVGSGSTAVQNSILWGNTASSSGSQIYDEVSIEVDTSIVEDGGTGIEGGAATTTSKIVDRNPRFVNATGPDDAAGTLDDSLQVLGDSPALGLGGNTQLPADVADLDEDGDTGEPVSLDLAFRPRMLPGFADSLDAGAYEGAASPSVRLNPPSNVQDSSADLSGEVVPYASSADATFEVEPTNGGTVSSKTQTVSGLSSPDSASAQLVGAMITGLQPGTEYSVRLVGDDGLRTTMSTTETFVTTASIPVVTTESATAVADSSATLNGMVNAGGDTARVYVALGRAASSGRALLTADTLETSLTEDQAVSRPTPDTLRPGTEYEFATVAASAVDSTTGDTLSFVTRPSVPVAATDSAGGIIDTSATLYGTVNPGGGSAEVAIRYWPVGDSAAAESATAAESPVGGTQATVVSAEAVGLSEETTYAFEVKAENAAGTTVSAPDTFETLDVRLMVQPDTTEMGPVQVGQMEQAEVELVNEGEVPLTEVEARVEGTADDDFRADAGDEAGPLGVAATRTLTVSFEPTETGRREAILVVRSAEGGSDTTALVGQGAVLSVESDARLGDAADVAILTNGTFGPEAGELAVRPGGTKAYRTISLTEGEEDGQLGATVPDTLITERGLDVYALLTDGADTLTVPAGGVEAARNRPEHLSVQFDSLAVPTTMPPEQYRMLTIPAVPEEGVTEALEAAYGDYDPSSWRLLRWTAAEGAYREFPSLDSIAEGRAFWLVTAEGESLTLGAGRSVDASTPRRIPLKAGWNQIGSPFPFAVRWDTVRAASGLSPEAVDGPVAWRDSAYRPEQATLEPWAGYFVFSVEADTLIVPPVGAETTEAGAASTEALRARPEALRGTDSLWGEGEPPSVSGSPSTAQISGSGQMSSREGTASANTGSDTYTLRVTPWAKDGSTGPIWIGLRDEAKRGRDSLDFAQPPPIGQSVRLSIQEQVEGRTMPHSGSFKPAGGGPEAGQSWILRIQNRTDEEQSVRLGLKSEGPLPRGQSRYVLDLAAERRTAPGQWIELGAEETRNLKVIVGTESFAEKESAGIALDVFTNELRGNYPNPFGQETTIGYTLEGAQEVTLEIYNVLGQRVRRLVQGEKDAGLHRVQWRGTNRFGDPVGSGVYFYRIEAESFTQTRKMVLVR